MNLITAEISVALKPHSVTIGRHRKICWIIQRSLGGLSIQTLVDVKCLSSVLASLTLFSDTHARFLEN